jgi:hypothetical protein
MVVVEVVVVEANLAHATEEHYYEWALRWRTVCDVSRQRVSVNTATSGAQAILRLYEI